MKTPIFVDGDGGLEVFSTREKAQASIEGVDVKNGVYTAIYDSDGYLLQITVMSLYDVVIQPANPPVNKADELHELLKMFLKRIKTVSVSDEWLADASLNDLVVKALEHKTW